MGLVLVGVVMLLLKLSALGPAALWPWWLVLAPFGAALLWWAVSDQMGWTSRAAQRREQERQLRRRDARMEAMGMRPSGKGRNGDSRHGSPSHSGPVSRPEPTSPPRAAPTGVDRPADRR